MGEKLNFDPYELLEVNEDSSDKEILKGFRKMALKWHPDKNPDRLKLATEMFLKVQKAFEILTDAAAKSALDRLRKAQRATKIRNKELDEKRRKLKEELESRENKSKSDKDDEIKLAKNFENEIERLRREGSKLLQKEKEEIDRQVLEELKKCSVREPSTSANSSDQSLARLKVRWKVTKTKDETTVYTEQRLRNIFTKYGQLGGVVVGQNPKTGSALVEFLRLDGHSGEVERETGDVTCPLKATWIQRPASPVTVTSTTPEPPPPIRNQLVTGDDFESHVLSMMKQAEERKKLIAQMMQDDADDVT